MIRIIAGKHKNRVIPTFKKAKYRPSTGKFKEALFSILTSGEFVNHPILQGARVLDLFCGTGSLSFEALSRGAESATLIDIDAEYLHIAKDFAKNIGEEKNTSFLNLNATNLPKSAYQYNLVFMDPPYYNGLISKAISSLLQNGWLDEGAIIAIELSKTEDYLPSDKLSVIIERIYGNNKLIILRLM